MSSPAPSNAGGARKPLEQITFRFCSECSNMLYPKEDEADRKLLFTCRTCSYSEEATSSCIFRNVLNNAAGETAGVTQDVGSDPTVGDTSPDSSPAMHIPRTHACSPYLWCACCGKPITCEVCHKRYATASVPDDSSLAQFEDDLTEPEVITALSWDPSDDDFSDFTCTEGYLQGFTEEEDEDEMLGSDPINSYTTKSMEMETEDCQGAQHT